MLKLMKFCLNISMVLNLIYTSPRSQNDIINIIGYDIDNVCKIFLSKHPRRMSIVSVIFFRHAIHFNKKFNILNHPQCNVLCFMQRRHIPLPHIPLPHTPPYHCNLNPPFQNPAYGPEVNHNIGLHLYCACNMAVLPLF